MHGACSSHPCNVQLGLMIFAAVAMAVIPMRATSDLNNAACLIAQLLCAIHGVCTCGFSNELFIFQVTEN